MLFKKMFLILVTSALTFSSSSVHANEQKESWIGTWATSQIPPLQTGISSVGFHNETVRMIVRPSIQGEMIRLRFSNKYGSSPLTFDKVNIALADSGAQLIAGTDQTVTFQEERIVTIPIGKEVVSDPVPFQLEQNADLAISVYLSTKSGPTTWHKVSNQTSYVAKGDHTQNERGRAYHNSYDSWFWIDGVDVLTEEKESRVIVAVGDSITDGLHSTLNANNRYPDYLSVLLKKHNANKISVLNAGISGNQLFGEYCTTTFHSGDTLLDRLEHDVLSQTGVTDIILLEGINDIGRGEVRNPHKIISGLKQVAAIAKEKGLQIYVGTLTPVKGHRYYSIHNEKTRDYGEQVDSSSWKGVF